MRKKIQKLTEEDLERYERALQLWEVALQRQEDELEQREDNLLMELTGKSLIRTAEINQLEALYKLEDTRKHEDPPQGGTGL